MHLRYQFCRFGMDHVQKSYKLTIKNTVKVLAHLVIITLLWGILGVGSRGVLKVLPKSIYLAYAIEISLRMT